MKKLCIITNEKIYSEDKNIYCDNIDQKNTPEKLQKFFDLNVIGRNSKKKRFHKINFKSIYLSKSIFDYIYKIFILTKDKNTSFLIISITPYTFLASLFLKVFKIKPFVYLRSDGFGEYKAIIGLPGLLFYKFMFEVVSKISNLISCEEYILKGKVGSIVTPSQLDNSWISNYKLPEINKPKLLYVGRMKTEKGIFSLLKMLKYYERDFVLQIVGSSPEEKIINQKNIIISNIETNQTKLIKYYDDSNIFILPSFTEGHPMVIYEALSRKRPIIVFEDIQHVKKNFKGIFVAKRSLKSLSSTIDQILQNYEGIQNQMLDNQLVSNDQFINSFKDILLKG